MSNPHESTKLLTRSQGAEQLNCSTRTIDKEIAAGNLAAVRIGRAVRIRPSALAYYIEAHESRVNLRRSNSRAKSQQGKSVSR